MKNIPHFINGQLDDGDGHRVGPVFNPSMGVQTANCRYADQSTLNRTVEIAKKASLAWGSSSHAARQAVIFKFRELVIANYDHFAEIIGQENGKTIADAKGEIGRAIEAIEFAAGAPHITKGEYATNVGGGIDVFSMRVPLGIVGCITPFNFPVMVPVVMFAMAISVVNAIVWKPSEKVPTAGLELARLFKEAGLPDGVFNVLNGDKELVDAILEHPSIPAISFVGSTRVGEYVYQKGTSHNKRVAAFTGGKNHMVVMPDADMEAAATAFVTAGFGSASQRCMAVSLLLPVGEGTAERLLQLILPKMKALKVGSYDDPAADYGAVISAESKASIEKSIETCLREGGKLIQDGRQFKVTGKESGYFLGPTLFDHVTTEMDLYQHEVFGPVRGIVRSANLDEAIAITNSHEYGNGSVIYTRDGKSAHRFASEIESGMIGVNVPVPLPAGFFNFGGLRRSKFGEGHLFGPDAARFYTKIKTVSQRWPEPAKKDDPISLAFYAND